MDYVYSGGRMIAKVAGGTTSYLLSDRLSARLTLDSSGAVIGQQGHLPYGEDFAESGSQQRRHFTGYERDSESGTDYAVNRQYNLSIGRFSRPDPYRGSYIQVSPQSFNRYTYVMNDPIGHADLSGLGEEFPPIPPSPPGGPCLWWGECDQRDPFAGGWYMDIKTSSIDIAILLRLINNAISKIDARLRIDSFLKAHPACETKINLAAQEAGRTTIWGTFEGMTFVDTRNTPDLLGFTLGALNFPAEIGERILNEPLLVAVETARALTNWNTRTVYTGTPFYALDDLNKSSTLVHEVLHNIFQNDHIGVAEQLGLVDPKTGRPYDDDNEASEAIDTYLDNNCQ